jgi:hypothetical protein
MTYNRIFTVYACQELEAFLKGSLIQQAMLLPTDNFSQQRSRYRYRLKTGIAVLLYSERFCRQLFATLRKQVKYEPTCNISWFVSHTRVIFIIDNT